MSGDLLSVEQSSCHLEMNSHLTAYHVGVITVIDNELVGCLASGHDRLMVWFLVSLQAGHSMWRYES